MAPLHLAAEQGHRDVVQTLVAGGAHVNVVNRRDDTPLHLAAGEGRLAVVELLVARGANVNARNASNRKPGELAKDSKTRNILLGKRV